MEILLQLGANETAFIQFILFIIAISFLTTVVFNPYFKAYDERLKKTKGADAVAKESVNEAKNLELIYKNKAREINEKINTIFEAQKKIATAASEDLMSQAKVAAEKQTAEAVANIAQQKVGAKAQIQQLSTEISDQLKQKFESGL